MPARSLLLTGAVPVSGGPRAGHLGASVAADLLVRRASAEGFPLPWVAAALPRGLVGQRAAEEDLRRERLDRAALGREAFVARVSALAALLTAAVGQGVPTSDDLRVHAQAAPFLGA